MSSTNSDPYIQTLMKMLKSLQKEMLEEMRKDSPDDGRIATLVTDINNLDLQIEKIQSSQIIGDDGKEGEDTKNSNEDYTIATTDLLKVRYSYTSGDKDALGCVTLNPNCRSSKNKDITYVYGTNDVSNSMGDDALLAMAEGLVQMCDELIRKGSNVKLTLIAYGMHANVFLDEYDVTRENFQYIKKMINTHIGNPYMGKIRSDTQFTPPLTEMFKRGNKHGDDSVYIWWSDGIENGGCCSAPLTNIKELVEEYFNEGPRGKMCTATYKNNCGENTQMQQMSELWGDNGYFTNIDNIPAIISFTKESLEDTFYSTFAKDVVIMLPDGTEKTIPQIKQIPIDIVFKIPVDIKTRIGHNIEFIVSDTMATQISCEFNAQDGNRCKEVYDTVDKIQIGSTGVIESSINTEYAHCIDKFYKLQKRISGVSDDAEKDIPLLKEASAILNKAGHWDIHGKFIHKQKIQGRNMRNIAADHQVQAKETYDEINTSINVANRIIEGTATKDEARVYGYATRGMSNRACQASRGVSQYGGYSREVSAYGATITVDDASSTDTESDSDIPLASICDNKS